MGLDGYEFQLQVAVDDVATVEDCTFHENALRLSRAKSYTIKHQLINKCLHGGIGPENNRFGRGNWW